uniref:Uncharacterized protein n=1 Tax=Rhodnius prolixus TaxID=13249 RepID=T1I9U1_RHOPR
MGPPTFDYILEKIRSKLRKLWKNCHGNPIPIEEKLVITFRQFTDVFQLEVFILTLFKPFESTFISHISTYLDVIAYLYIFD